MNIYDFTVKDTDNNEVALKKYEGKVVLIVNTATKCGLTPQYEALETFYEKYHERGVEVLDFPCNQFLEQAPGTMEEINNFCTLTYHTTFPRFAKIDVNGAATAPLFKYLKAYGGSQITNEAYPEFAKVVKDLQPYHDEEDIKWNFTKFLVNKQGQVVARYAPTVTPAELSGAVEKLL